MDFSLSSSSVTQLIQLSLVPVFLLVSIGQILNVVTGRLARIVERARWFDTQKESGVISTFNEKHCEELHLLSRRMGFANTAISFLSGAAVLVCFTVALLFVNGIVDGELDSVVLCLFMLVMIAITLGVISFFVEVSISRRSLRILKSYK